MCEWRPEEHPGRSPGRGGKREKERKGKGIEERVGGGGGIEAGVGRQ